MDPDLPEATPANGNGELSGISFPLDPVLLAEEQAGSVTDNLDVTNEQDHPVVPPSTPVNDEVPLADGNEQPPAPDLATVGGQAPPSHVNQGAISNQAYFMLPAMMNNGSFDGAQRNYLLPVHLKALY